ALAFNGGLCLDCGGANLVAEFLEKIFHFVFSLSVCCFFGFTWQGKNPVFSWLCLQENDLTATAARSSATG
ncbi:MAG: hypothetical protein MJ078_08825, partial [Clostridia bacterium]|nr:hypothetical protein [Clostridia bacterium]